MDTNIAHSSADPVARQVTIKVDGVHQAMDTLAEVFRRYYGLFTPSTLATLTPTLQQDFFAGFRQPLDARGVRAAVEPVPTTPETTSPQSRCVARYGDP